MLLLLFGARLPLKVNPKYLYSGQGSFPAKRAAERIVISVDFKDELAEGEVIESAEWFVKVYGENGEIQPDMVYASASIDGSVVMQVIRGGVPGVAYEVYCLAKTSGSQVLSSPDPNSGILKVM